MPCSTAVKPAPGWAMLCAAALLAAALCCVAPPARAADAPAKKDPDTTVTIKAFPPSVQVDATKSGDEDEASDDKPAGRRGSTRVRIGADDEDFDAFSGQVHKNPWIIGLIFLVVGSIFLTPVVLVIGIIWYKLRKTRLQNEAMLRLAERGVVPPGQAAEALAAGAPPASAAPQLYQQAVAWRRRVVWSDLRKGIILSMLGLAFTLYWLTSGGQASWVGLILLFVGIGYVTLWWLEGRHLEQQASAGRAGNGAAQATGVGRESNDSSVTGPSGG